MADFDVFDRLAGHESAGVMWLTGYSGLTSGFLPGFTIPDMGLMM
jgi:hypothetical protein